MATQENTQKALKQTFEEKINELTEVDSIMATYAKKLGEVFAQAAEPDSSRFDPKLIEVALEEYANNLNLPSKFVTEHMAKLKEQIDQARFEFLSTYQDLHSLSDDDMNNMSRKLGGSGKEFGFAADANRWLDGKAEDLSGFTDEKYGELVKKLDGTIPDILKNSSDAFGELFFGIIKGTESSSAYFEAFGDTINQVVDGIIKDFIQLGTRTLLFGGGEGDDFFGQGGGLFGNLFGLIGSGISSMFGGSGVGNTFGGAYTSGVIQDVPRYGPYGGSAHGNVFAGGSLSDYRNTIVSSPTLFSATAHISRFAKGYAPRLGLMGEAGPEAIMPLARLSGGDLGVKAMIGTTAPTVQMDVVINNNSDARVRTQQSRSADGTPRLDVLIEMVDKALEAKEMQGRSRIGNAVRKNSGTNRAAALYNR